jgi:hypothetical protein
MKPQEWRTRVFVVQRRLHGRCHMDDLHGDRLEYTARRMPRAQ